MQSKCRTVLKIILFSVLTIVLAGCVSIDEDTQAPQATPVSNTEMQTASLIHIMDAPIFTRNDEGGYSFVSFGDTRTSSNKDLDITRAGEDGKTKQDIETNIAFKAMRDKVHISVRDMIKIEQAGFSLYTGDMIWQGFDPIYWEPIKNELVPVDIRSIDNPKFFPILGNHELWTDENHPVSEGLTNFMDVFPYLSKNEEAIHNYAFIIGKNLFFSFCSGGYGDLEKEPETYWDQIWTCTEAPTKEAYKTLMDEALEIYKKYRDAEGVNNIFIQYHKPSYSRYKHPPLKYDYDPIESFKGIHETDPDVKIMVFNGHNHTTELYNPYNNIMALVPGGGGAIQKDGVEPHDGGKKAPELFWPALDENKTKRICFFTINIDKNDEILSLIEHVLVRNYDPGDPEKFVGDPYFTQGITIKMDGQVDISFIPKEDVSYDVGDFIDFYY